MTGLSAIMYLYLLALGMFAVSVAADQIIIYVDSSQTLEEQLQNISNGAMKNVVLELDSSQGYKLSQGTFTSFVNITITKVKRILKIVCIHFDVSRYADSRNSFDFSIACFVQKIQSLRWNNNSCSPQNTAINNTKFTFSRRVRLKPRGSDPIK